MTNIGRLRQANGLPHGLAVADTILQRRRELLGEQAA
jgi:hypothetical protein